MFKKDLIVIGSIIVIAIIIGVFNYFSSSGPVDSLIIIYKSEILQREKLPSDKKIIINKGSRRWEIEIKGNRARILSSNCPSKRCVEQGWVEKGGETLICLPQHFMLKLEKENYVDAVTQ